jgi:hypothetical protein
VHAVPNLLAHAGGWDELLVLAVPVGLYAVVRLWDRVRGEPGDDTGQEEP